MDQTKSPSPARWKLKDHLVLIAVLAMSLAAFGVAGTILLGLMFSPVFLAPRGLKLSRSYWTFASYPIFVAFSFFITALGDQLGALERSPLLRYEESNKPVSGTYFLFLTLFLGSPFVIMPLIFWTFSRVSNPARAQWNGFAQTYEFYLVPLLWLLGLVLLAVASVRFLS